MMHDGIDPTLGWIVFGMTVWLVAIGVAFAVAVRAIRRPPPRDTARLPSPLDVLERRFAAGQISREDFDEARARLREHELDV